MKFVWQISTSPSAFASIAISLTLLLVGGCRPAKPSFTAAEVQATPPPAKPTSIASTVMNTSQAGAQSLTWTNGATAYSMSFSVGVVAMATPQAPSGSFLSIQPSTSGVLNGAN